MDAGAEVAGAAVDAGAAAEIAEVTDATGSVTPKIKAMAVTTSGKSLYTWSTGGVNGGPFDCWVTMYPFETCLITTVGNGAGGVVDVAIN